MREGTGTGKDPLEHVSLIDVHRCFTREETSSSDGAIVREIILSFFRTLGQFLPTDDNPRYVRFMCPVLDAVGMLEQNRLAFLISIGRRDYVSRGVTQMHFWILGRSFNQYPCTIDLH